MAPVLHPTRASCTALRFAEELCGGAGTSSSTTRAALAVLLSLALVGCGPVAASSDTADEPLRLSDAQPTVEALGRHVLGALARQDESALESVRLTEREHNEIIWPELPASSPEINFPVDYAWTNIQNRNRSALARILPTFADRTFGFQGVECRGAVETFRTFSVQTDCHVLFAVDDGPEVWEIQAFKDVVVRGGAYKIFRYYDEEPRRLRGDRAP